MQCLQEDFLTWTVKLTRMHRELGRPFEHQCRYMWAQLPLDDEHYDLYNIVDTILVQFFHTLRACFPTLYPHLQHFPGALSVESLCMPTLRTACREPC